MKKLLCLALALLTLLSCACGAQPESGADDNDDVILAADADASLVNLAVSGTNEIREAPLEKGYTRGGKYANKNWRQINAELGVDTNTDEPFYLKTDNSNEYTRHVYFTFDLTKIGKFNFKKVFFSPSFTSIDESMSIIYNIYLVDDTSWKTDTLTWNNAPKKGAVIASGIEASHLSAVDLTEAVNDALVKGKTKISFAMVMTSKSGQNDINSKLCQLVATTQNEVSNFIYQLVADEAQNKAIWDYAAQVVSEWHTRYLAIKDKELPAVQLIESDADEFSKTVYTSGTGFGNNWTLSNVNLPQPTRTYSALDDLGTYSDYDKEQVFDVYGGLMDPSVRQEATGFFYSKKLGDRWWIIDPLGYPCYIRAMHHVSMNYLDSPNQKNAAIERYGSAEKWAIATVGQLKDRWYFNAGDSRVDGLTTVENQMVYQTSGGSYAAGYGSKLGVNSSDGGSTHFSENDTMPIFDPGFVEYSDQKASLLVKNKDDQWILGYTTDNELPLDENMLGSYLSVDYSKEVNYYSYAAAWTWLGLMTGKEAPSAKDITNELQELFRGFVYDRYFNVVTTAIKKYDPNHMYLGCRFLTKVKDAEWVARFAAEYLDCMTVNWYGDWQPEAQALYEFCSVVNLPLMVTEFYTKALENDGSFDNPDDPLKNTRAAGWVVRTQQDRGDFYQNFTLRLLECKYFVGWHWHMYLDDDDSPEVIYNKDGSWRDQSNIDANKGIVNNWHEPYEELVTSMAEINKNVYRLIEHFDAKYAK